MPACASGLVARAGLALLSTLVVACGKAPPAAGALAINEVLSRNEGAAVDDHGETEDAIELVNTGAGPVRLDAYTLRDRSDKRARLPAIALPQGATIVLWADGTPDQGARHLPFRLSSAGESIVLETLGGQLVDAVDVPALATNEVFARLPSGIGSFARCRFASLGRPNPDVCEPPPPPELSDDFEPQHFEWPAHWPPIRGPLVLSELRLKPSDDEPAQIEVLNASSTATLLDEFAIRIAAQAPGRPYPRFEEGTLVPWPDGARSLEAGERVVLTLDDDAQQALGALEDSERIVTIFERDQTISDRIEVMHWPEGATLARMPDGTGRPLFCREHTLGAANDTCEPLRERTLGDRARNLYTEGDFEALAAGDTSLTARGVKFVIDLQAGGAVHFLSGRQYALHYQFVREMIDGEPSLDRCDPVEAAAFDRGWHAFSEREYFQSTGRRYLLGTLEHHPSSDVWNVAYTLGDQISAAQMLQGFFAVMAHVHAPKRFALRPTEPRQTALVRTLDGRLPLIGMNEPYRGIHFQALTEGVGFGVLTFVGASELADTALGRDVIVITDDVPSDIPLVGGLITEALQTPLAHVNVLSKNRGTPNMALRDARSDRQLSSLLGELVRLQVSAGGFEVRRADAAEADAFYQERAPSGPRFVPRLDRDVRGVQALEQQSVDDLPAIGAKAAQLAELMRLDTSACGGPMPTPAEPFAIPVVHSLEHFERSGALEILHAAEEDPAFRADPAMRAATLARVQQRILQTPVEDALLREVTEAIETRFGSARVRMRSSSNTEDLPRFNGAGLYTSISAAIDDRERPIDDALRTVWASLFSLRAYDEREQGHIDQGAVAMAVLVHPAFLSERANAVAISRNVLDPIRSDIYYLNAQLGEASVVNPAPGVVTEQFTYRLFPFSGSPAIEYQSHSTFSPDKPVLQLAEVRSVACYLGVIHQRLQALHDPEGLDRYFAVDIELKLLGRERELLIKQARPYSFGRIELPSDCRDF